MLKLKMCYWLNLPSSLSIQEPKQKREFCWFYVTSILILFLISLSAFCIVTPFLKTSQTFRVQPQLLIFVYKTVNDLASFYHSSLNLSPPHTVPHHPASPLPASTHICLLSLIILDLLQLFLQENCCTCHCFCVKLPPHKSHVFLAHSQVSGDMILSLGRLSTPEISDSQVLFLCLYSSIQEALYTSYRSTWVV